MKLNIDQLNQQAIEEAYKATFAKLFDVLQDNIGRAMAENNGWDDHIEHFRTGVGALKEARMEATSILSGVPRLIEPVVVESEEPKNRMDE